MKAINQPKLSIGLPVYNGQNYLEEALDSLLSQTYHNFELIISDNGSIDRTEEICRSYMEIDERIKYFRNEENKGATWNLNNVFKLSAGIFFKWAAHDDLCKPTYLSKCIRNLENDPSIVLCYARTISINSKDKVIRKWDSRPGLSSSLAEFRFREALDPTETFPIWGVIRSSVMKKTRALGDFPGHDRPFLSELSILGRFHEIPEFLFINREHNERSVRAYDYRKPLEALEWYNPSKAGETFLPTWRLFLEHLGGINRAPIRINTRINCYIELLRWLSHKKSDFVQDIVNTGQRLNGIGPIIERIDKNHQIRVWGQKSYSMANDIESIIQVDEKIILIDESSLDPQVFDRWVTNPFPENEGKYWGPPTSNTMAIKELEMQRLAGARFLVVAWPAFWWLDYYQDFSRYLDRNYPCVLKNDRSVIFDLRK